MTEDSILPAGLTQWVAQITGGEVDSLTQHVARREAWVASMKPGSPGDSSYFLRIDRAAMAGTPGVRDLRRETRVIETLASRGFPIQRIVGWNDEFCAALQSFVPGKANLSEEPDDVRHQVMLHFMEILADLHDIDIAALSLPDFTTPRTAFDHALDEIDAAEQADRHPRSICKTNLLAAFGKRWLINHAPETVERTCLLQGDTGPANFLYDPASARVTAVIDWEWAHFGDPLEDLGNVWVRNFFCPSAKDLTPYFRHYANRTGLSLDRRKILYYAIHQLVRSVFGLGYAAASHSWREPVWLKIAYQAIVDLQTCNMMLEAAGDRDDIDTPVPLSAAEGDDVSLHSIMARQMEEFVLPDVTDSFARFTVEGHIGLIRYLERSPLLTRQIDEIEREGLSAILGTDATDLRAARASLIAHIERLTIDEEAPVLRHLHRMALAQAELARPLMGPWSTSTWARLDL